ncbi:MAG: hypothetical protein V3R64_06540 [Sphingomonadales bacterium]
MNNFFQELKRRNVVRVGVAYLVVGWVILQFVDVILEIVTFPDWFSQMVLVLLIIGFPIALIVSWAFEVTPEGVKKTSEVDKSKTITHGTSQKINYLIIGGLVIAVAFLMYERSAGLDDQIVGPASAGTLTIAVLPFADLSPEGDQEYFSDGITEEILNVLVKVPDLRVAGRTSSFAFKGRNKNLTKIGEDLNVEFLVEGSVRKSGNQLRITAQLIRSNDGFHIWSETYDREFTEIFEVQDEISRAIAEALSVSLGLEDMNLVPNQTEDLVAYEEYLKALGLFKLRGYAGLSEAIGLLTAVTIRDPNFVSGWELLAKVYSVYPFYGPNRATNEVWERYLTLSELAANKALSLDPGSAIAYSSLGSVYGNRRQWQKSFEYHQKALELDSWSGDIHQQYAENLGMAGRNKEAAEIAGRGADLEPLSAIIINVHGSFLIDIGEFEKGFAILRKSNVLDPNLDFPVNFMIFMYLDQGRFDEAYTTAQIANQQSPDPFYEDTLILIEMLKSGAPEDEMNSFVANSQFGLLDPMLRTALRDADTLITNIKIYNYDTFEYGNPILMSRSNRFFWGHPLFKSLVRRAGLYDYWKTSGNWADDCRPIGDDDFECTP